MPSSSTTGNSVSWNERYWNPSGARGAPHRHAGPGSARASGTTVASSRRWPPWRRTPGMALRARRRRRRPRDPRRNVRRSIWGMGTASSSGERNLVAPPLPPSNALVGGHGGGPARGTVRRDAGRAAVPRDGRRRADRGEPALPGHPPPWPVVFEARPYRKDDFSDATAIYRRFCDEGDLAVCAPTSAGSGRRRAWPRTSTPTGSSVTTSRRSRGSRSRSGRTATSGCTARRTRASTASRWPRSARRR